MFLWTNSKVKIMLNEIRTVDMDYGILLGALPIEDIEKQGALNHQKINKQTSIIMRCLNKIDIYLADPDLFRSRSLIGVIHEILLEAT